MEMTSHGSEKLIKPIVNRSFPPFSPEARYADDPRLHVGSAIVKDRIPRSGTGFFPRDSKLMKKKHRQGTREIEAG